MIRWIWYSSFNIIFRVVLKDLINSIIFSKTFLETILINFAKYSPTEIMCTNVCNCLEFGLVIRYLPGKEQQNYFLWNRNMIKILFASGKKSRLYQDGIFLECLNVGYVHKNLDCLCICRSWKVSKKKSCSI